MEADVSICSKPGNSRRTLSLIATGGIVWSLMLVLLVASGETQADGVPSVPISTQASAAAKSSSAESANTSSPVAAGVSVTAPAPAEAARVTTTANPASAASSSEREAQLAAKLAELDTILAERQKLEDNLQAERAVQANAKLQQDNAKKLIRLEMEDFFAASNNSERLDSLLGEYKREADRYAAASERVAAVEKDLAGQHLRFAQAERDVERVKAQLAAEIRERNARKIQSVARALDRTVEFDESVSFRCSPNKSLAACLSEQGDGGRMAQWVQDNYQRALAAEIAEHVSDLNLNPSWYRYRTMVQYSQASMMLDGTVTAQLNVKAAITAKKMMACALLEVPYELCDSPTHSLIVRSNKFGDQVTVNGETYGATPVSLVLEPGNYQIQVSAGGKTQQRTVSLNGDRVVHFTF